ncbi:MAG TPA: DUF5715 family protein [Pyrinomonadaceae bacterium]|nr:DUF5715 family protein [Pyrinomonadaceae bacterium]
MTEVIRRFVVPVALSAVVGVSVWAALHFSAPRRNAVQATATIPGVESGFDSERWLQAVERAKADRLDVPSGAALTVPAELRHYDDRHWFLATQVAEVKKQSLQTCQDYVDLAAMIQRGQMVAVPAVTDDFVLLGVGAKTDDGPFTKYEDDQTVPLYEEAELRDEYGRLEAAGQRGPGSDKKTGSSDKRGAKPDFGKPGENKDQPPRIAEDKKELLDRYYGDPVMRQQLLAGYEGLRALAQNFHGRSYDLQNPIDRQTMKMNMLSSLRPQALKVLQEIAGDYRRQFERPLPISSLVRPEQYQHTLRRYNRAATTIDTPPHSTGLAFDIDYRYMSIPEQNFVMADLARLKDAGRVEVLRERNANFHVFAFVDGVRPNDDLIAASREEAGAPPDEPENANKPAPKPAPAHPAAREKPAKSRGRAKH